MYWAGICTRGNDGLTASFNDVFNAIAEFLSIRVSYSGLAATR